MNAPTSVVVGERIIDPGMIKSILLSEINDTIRIEVINESSSLNTFITIGAHADGVLKLVAAWFEAEDYKYRERVLVITTVADKIKRYLSK